MQIIIDLHCIFGDTTLEPVLIQFVACLVDCHSSLKVINTAGNDRKIKCLTFLRFIKVIFYT